MKLLRNARIWESLRSAAINTPTVSAITSIENKNALIAIRAAI